MTQEAAFEEVDVAIVGGGPGGAATAIHCAQAGLKVMVLEDTEFPRDRPGETLHPGIEPLLQQLGLAQAVLAAEFLRHKGIEIEWQSARRFEAYGSDGEGVWRGFQVRRAEFDSLLMRRAREVGARVCQPCRALRILHEGGRVIGVETSSGGIRAKFVVDAAGSRHWLAKQLGITLEKYSPRLVARYGYAQGECPQRDAAPLLKSQANGWIWTARVAPRRYAWVHLTFKREKFEPQWLPPEFMKLEAAGASKGADVTWRCAASSAGSGYFLVGDAATVLDPASSHGVLKAIMSGIMAAHSITCILRQGGDEVEIAVNYRDWMRAWFEHDVRRLKELYAVFPLTGFNG